MTIEQARKKALEILIDSKKNLGIGSLSPSLDISVILSCLLGVSKSYLMAHTEAEIGEYEKQFFEAIQLRSTGIPVSYITGIKEFWGLPFKVSPAVLIPKPDTEILVERAIHLIEKRNTSTMREPLKVLDVCTGSGCIAISIKKNYPQIEMTALDISPQALEIARENSFSLLPQSTESEKEPITFIEADLREGFPDHYHLIISNPPYVPTTIANSLLCDGRGEPILALDGGTDGLDLVRFLIHEAKKALFEEGTILIETGEYNAKEAASYLKENGFIDIVIHKDLEGQDRVVEGTLA